jgi:eukaryotic-like serine/threonine-protein kinase
MSKLPAGNNAADSAKDAPPVAETLAYHEVVADTGPPVQCGPSDSGQSAAPIKPPSLVGQVFDDLEILEELGRGGMGLVYKARQKSLDRLVAVKLLLAEHYADPTRLARFQAEARAAASLTHTNIVQVYQVGQCALGHYFAMEYIDGRSLESYIQKRNTTVAAAVSVMVVVADAVHYAHTKGIVHRDLKPANIMIDRTKRPVVMDFGIAKFVGKSSSLTQQGVVMGTPAYMAPEQAAGAPEEVGPHSDVYSLGAILYTLLAGRAPYEEETALKTVLKVIGLELPVSLRKLRPEVPKQLDGIVMKCLAKKPADRCATAQEFANELRDFRAGKEERTAASTIRKKKPEATMDAAPPLALTLVSRSTGKKLHISRPMTLLGRSSDCDFVLKASDVSKHHCRISIDEEQVSIEDLDSANGTFVNDKRVRRGRLVAGDLLRIAGHEFLVRVREV